MSTTSYYSLNSFFIGFLRGKKSQSLPTSPEKVKKLDSTSSPAQPPLAPRIEARGSKARSIRFRFSISFPYSADSSSIGFVPAVKSPGMSSVVAQFSSRIPNESSVSLSVASLFRPRPLCNGIRVASHPLLQGLQLPRKLSRSIAGYLRAALPCLLFLLFSPSVLGPIMLALRLSALSPCLLSLIYYFLTWYLERRRFQLRYLSSCLSFYF